MKRVGVTGGMGCGKSTVVAEFKALGVSCFVADSVAATYYNEPDFIRTIADHFGTEVLDTDGHVNKQRLAACVFSDKKQLERLNAIVHPRVWADFEAFCHQHKEEHYLLFESAILYEHHFDRRMDCVVGVYLDLEERLKRLSERDHASRETLLARINNQDPAEEILTRADFVVLNYEGNPRKRQVAYIDSILRKS